MKHEICGVEHLHRHTTFSLLDGFATVEEYAEYSKEVNQKFLCVTDHGVMGSVPQQIRMAEEYKLHPIFGCEIYVNPMQPFTRSSEESKNFRASLDDVNKKKFDKSNHLLLLAYNEIGYRNLVKITSWGWLHGFYRKPRVNHNVLREHREGLIILSGCANSEIAQAFLNNYSEEEGYMMLEKYLDIFGRDHFYLELMMLDFKLQKPYDAFLLKAHDKYGLPIVISQDCLTKDTLVLTKNGHKPISELNPGEFVLTHKNRWRKIEVVAHRKLKKNEKVYNVSTKIDKNAFSGTANHKLFVASKKNDSWAFEKKTIGTIATDDYLLIPKISSNKLFNVKGINQIDLMKFISKSDYQIGGEYLSSPKGNMGCKLQYWKEEEVFISYRGWNRKYKTTIPRYLNIDDDFLEVLGWYIAEGWSDTSSNQVGFAFHANESLMAKKIIKYFKRYGIKTKIYKVSENGIAIRFSSIVFNKIFKKLCGHGAKNKHLPYIDGTWINRWSQYQLGKIIYAYWAGDGSYNTSGGKNFGSTSPMLINELKVLFLSLGIVCGKSCELKKRETWNDVYRISCTGNRDVQMDNFFMGREIGLSKHQNVEDLGEYWACKITNIDEIDYKDEVYDIQVEEDHTFLVNNYRVENCHYCRKEHSHNQRLMLMIKNGKTIQQIEELKKTETDLFELQDENLWMKAEWELDDKWERDYQDIIDYELYKQAKRNTIHICEFAKGVKLDRTMKLPKIPDADLKLKEAIAEGMKFRGISFNQKEYMKRFREEYDLIVSKEFSSYFLIQKEIMDEARRVSPILLGWGDGSEATGVGRGCLTLDSPLYLKNGSVTTLSEINIGDFVFTNDGTYQKVLNKFIYQVNEDLLNIKTFYGDWRGITLTKDHKVYAEKEGILDWIPASELSVGDWLYQPNIDQDDKDNSLLKYLDIINYKDLVIKNEADITKHEVKSYALANEIRFLLLKIGLPSALSILENHSYLVTSPILFDKNNNFWKKIDGGILTQVRSIEEANGVKFVGDIEVENNSNYLTTSFLVHNSAVGSLICYALGITDVDPVKHDLLFSRFLSPSRGGKTLKTKYNCPLIKKS